VVQRWSQLTKTLQDAAESCCEGWQQFSVTHETESNTLEDCRYPLLKKEELDKHDDCEHDAKQDDDDDHGKENEHGDDDDSEDLQTNGLDWLQFDNILQPIGISVLSFRAPASPQKSIQASPHPQTIRIVS
jgi:ABC-type Zn2+ transport system substrate-binding protein/surface adhesin